MNLFELLPFGMISNKKINNIRVNYEDYLIELLNNSSYFMNLTENDRFNPINNQAHGESDAVANDYEIDFKLLVPKNFMNFEYKSLPNIDYSLLSSGIIEVNNNDSSKEKMHKNAYRYFCNFILEIYRYDTEKLFELSNNKENILCDCINNMLVDKNLFIFIPCSFNTTINTIKKLFSLFFSIRNNIKKDTFFSFLHNNQFYILKYSNNNFEIADRINKILISSFNDLYKITNVF